MLRNRLLRRVAIFTLLFYGLYMAPHVPPFPEISQAQGQFNLIGPGGTVYYTTASQAYMNRADALTIFSGTIPGSLFSTAAAANFGQVANLGMANSSIPLHLIQEGTYNSSSGSPIFNVAVNFGVGSTTNPKGCTAGSGVNNCWFATINLLNGFAVAPSQVNQPWRLDVWMNPIATLTATNATPNIVNTVFIKARMELAGGIAASGGVTNSAQLVALVESSTIAQVNIASAHILNTIWQIGVAAATSSYQVYKTILRQGE